LRNSNHGNREYQQIYQNSPSSSNTSPIFFLSDSLIFDHSGDLGKTYHFSYILTTYEVVEIK